MGKKRKSTEKKSNSMVASSKSARLNVTKKKKGTKKHFIQEMKDQMKKVSWTTKEELYVCGRVVIGAIFTLGIGIYVIDLLIRSLLNEIGHLVIGA